VVEGDLFTGREALHRLDQLVERARGDFDAAVRSVDGVESRRARLAQLKAEGYAELARLQLDRVRHAADAEALGEAERKARALLDEHAAFLAGLEPELEAAEAQLAEAEARRRAAEAALDEALAAYETQVAATEARLVSDPPYQGLLARLEEARAVVVRAAQKQEVALADREAKGAPYMDDPLFRYLWERRFRTPAYKAKGLTRSLDGWVAKVCGYDAAHLNYARLIELPDRLAEHAARMKLEAAEAEAAIERYEAAALEADGAARLGAAVADARAALKAADEALAAAEARRAELRRRQEEAARGDAGPLETARTLIETALAATSFPDLKVLASQTTTLDDDQIVEALIKLRTEELQTEVAARSAATAPASRRISAEALEVARRRFREAGLDSPYVALGRAAFEAAIEAWGLGRSADGEKLYRALAATVRQAPHRDDSYFGGRRRRDVIGVPDDVGDIAGLIIGEVVREALRSGTRGRWGGGWSGGGSRPGGWSGGGQAGSRGGGGGFRTSGRKGGGGFKTRGRF
jgi:hypothetical protein